MIDVLVVGGGPAGLAAAIHAARAGARVALMERNDRCGAKLLATGGGRANVSNLRPAGVWPALFGPRGRFIVPALDFLPREKLCSWLAGLGEPVQAADGFHFFPVSNSAKRLRDALAAEAERLGVAIRRGARAEAIAPAPSADGAGAGGFAATLADGSAIAAGRVIVATGGKSYPATGSTWDGCRLAAALGHRIRPAFPGLVGLRAANLDPALAGLVLPDAEIFFKAKGRGGLAGDRELLLTHQGLSGPAVLDLSASVAEALAETGGPAVVRVRWRAGMDKGCWLERMASWRAERGASPPAALLKEFLPERLARWLCRRAGLAEAATAATLRAAERDRLVESLADFPAEIAATEGWDKAMITRGGVDVREVDPGSLESRLVPGLFFAGETLDVDGPCGGYNLHWAFASGALAGESAGRWQYRHK